MWSHPTILTFISNLTFMNHVLATQASFRVSKLPTLSMPFSQSVVQLSLLLLWTGFSPMCINHRRYPKKGYKWVNESTLLIHFSSEASVLFFLFSTVSLILKLVCTALISPCMVINSLPISLPGVHDFFYLPSTYIHGWQEIWPSLEIPKEMGSN